MRQLLKEHLILVLFLSTVHKSSSEMSALSEKFVENSARFSAELFATIAKSDDPSKNIIISPLSVQTCVALTYAGASGETAKEIVKGLHLVSDNKEEVAASFSQLLDKYKSSSMLKIANRIYVNQNYKIKHNFQELNEKYFQSKADTLDVTNSAASAKKVNGWVEEQTNNKIKDLISPDNIDEYTRLVLVNAVYFKGNWAKKFDSGDTQKKSFFYNENDSTEVHMMSQKGKFRHAVLEDLDACVLELPYADSDLSMLIVLPNSRTGLKEMGSKLKHMSVSEINQELFETEVIVEMPKFKVEYSVEMNSALKELGVTKMFTNQAEFSNMLEEPENLKVSKVLHKAFIEVNEEGTEAAAATGMIMMMRCAFVPDQPVEFIVNRPFSYVIWDKKNILFAGKNVKFA